MQSQNNPHVTCNRIQNVYIYLMPSLKKKAVKHHIVSFRTSDALFIRLEQMVKKEKISRSDLCEQIMWTGLAALERVGNKIIN